MNTLTELNNRGVQTITFTDNRPAGIVFNTPTARDISISIAEGEDYPVQFGILIREIIQPSVVQCELEIDLTNAASTHTGTVLDYTIPSGSGITLTQVGDVYTFGYINNAADFNSLKASLVVNTPASGTDTFTYTGKIYSATNATQSWTVTIDPSETTIWQAAGQTSYSYGAASNPITNAPQLDTASVANWTVTVEPDTTTIIGTMTSGVVNSATTGFNASTKVFTITGTPTDINEHLRNLSFTTQAGTHKVDITLTYNADSGGVSTYDADQTVHNTYLLSNPRGVEYYDPGIVEALENTPIISKDTTANDLEQFTLTIDAMNQPNAITSMTATEGEQWYSAQNCRFYQTANFNEYTSIPWLFFGDDEYMVFSHFKSTINEAVNIQKKEADGTWPSDWYGQNSPYIPNVHQTILGTVSGDYGSFGTGGVAISGDESIMVVGSNQNLNYGQVSSSLYYNNWGYFNIYEWNSVTEEWDDVDDFISPDYDPTYTGTYSSIRFGSTPALNDDGTVIAISSLRMGTPTYGSEPHDSDGSKIYIYQESAGTYSFHHEISFNAPELFVFYDLYLDPDGLAMIVSGHNRPNPFTVPPGDDRRFKVMYYTRASTSDNFSLAQTIYQSNNAPFTYIENTEIAEEEPFIRVNQMRDMMFINGKFYELSSGTWSETIDLDIGNVAPVYLTDTQVILAPITDEGDRLWVYKWIGNDWVFFDTIGKVYDLQFFRVYKFPRYFEIKDNNVDPPTSGVEYTPEYIVSSDGTEIISYSNYNNNEYFRVMKVEVRGFDYTRTVVGDTVTVNNAVLTGTKEEINAMIDTLSITPASTASGTIELDFTAVDEATDTDTVRHNIQQRTT